MSGIDPVLVFILLLVVAIPSFIANAITKRRHDKMHTKLNKKSKQRIDRVPHLDIIKYHKILKELESGLIDDELGCRGGYMMYTNGKRYPIMYWIDEDDEAATWIRYHGQGSDDICGKEAFDLLVKSDIRVIK